MKVYYSNPGGLQMITVVNDNGNAVQITDKDIDDHHVGFGFANVDHTKFVYETPIKINVGESYSGAEIPNIAGMVIISERYGEVLQCLSEDVSNELVWKVPGEEGHIHNVSKHLNFKILHLPKEKS